jgi:hypothetical protein
MSEQTHATAKTIKIPGPDHPITIERNLKRVVISVGGTVLADSHDALILHEADYSAVQYIPRKDVDMTLMRPTAPTRVTAHTSVSRQAGSAPSTPSGPTRLPTRSWRPSRTTWLSTRTGWTPSRRANSPSEYVRVIRTHVGKRAHIVNPTSLHTSGAKARLRAEEPGTHRIPKSALTKSNAKVMLPPKDGATLLDWAFCRHGNINLANT